MDGTVRLTIKARPRSYTAAMPTARDPLYQRHRFPPEVTSHAIWLYFRFPLSLRMVEEMLATRGICVTYETVRQWGKKFGKAFADQIRQRAPARGDKWHMDAVLHLDRAAHGVDDAAELDDRAVAGSLDDTPVMRSDGGINEIATEAPQARQGAILVRRGESAVADNIGD